MDYWVIILWAKNGKNPRWPPFFGHDCQMSAADAASLHAKFKSKKQVAFLALMLGEKIFKIKKNIKNFAVCTVLNYNI